MLEISPIAEIAKAFKACCDSLGKSITPQECEKFGRFFGSVYGTENRAFHHLEHAMDVSEDCSPAGRIAAFFHDVVYKQVDHSKLPELNSLFGVFDPGHALELTIPSEAVLAQDPWRLALTTIFGMVPGQTIGPQSALNEFLSAWVAVQKLSPLLSTAQILHVVACVEATIPFRGEQKNPSAPEKLKSKIEVAAKTLKLNLSADEFAFILKDSVKISNNDVKGFTRATESFLHDSWALLYESNPALQIEFYTISQYREPMAKIEMFLAFLSPEKLFTRYDGFPSEEQLAIYHANTTKNLRLGRQYMRAKLFDVAILEAFAKISGGDCPLNLFTELRARVDHHLKHVVPKKQAHKRDDRLRNLLGNERIFKAPFPIETNLFGTFVYDSFSEEQAEQNHASAHAFFKGELSAEKFLNALPADLMVTIGDLLSTMVWTREAEIQAFVNLRRDEANAA